MLRLPGWSSFSHRSLHRALTSLALIAALLQTGCVATNCDGWRPANVAAPSPTTQTLIARSPIPPRGTKYDAGRPELREAFLKDPTRAQAAALAEYSYAQADQAERDGSDLCIDFFYEAAAYSYYHMFGFADSQANDPRMWDVYHSSVARLIQLGQTKGRIDPHKGFTVFGERAEVVSIDHKAGPWKADDFDQLLVVGDYDTSGISRRYKRDGFGVPLVGIRLRRNDGSPRDAFLAPRQSFGVTAILRPDLDVLLGKKVAQAKKSDVQLVGGVPSSKDVLNESNARLELIDPFRTETVSAGSQEMWLAADYSASFVALEDCQNLMRLDWLGFREPARLDKLSGLFFLEPYQRGKIPVVFIHGLWSDFHTWDETLNELRMDPTIRERYQFAVYLYPTGNPFALNAMKLRRTLNGMRSLADQPDPAMDEMVLVGHSMGGILARLQVSASNSILWDNVAKKPIESLKADPETYAILKDTFFFDPNPGVKRVVFVGTPQKGSNLGGSCLRRVASSLVRQPGELQEAIKKLQADNPGAFTPAFLGGLPTSIDNLATDNPTLKAINRMPLSGDTRLHSIVGHGKWLPLFQPGDGVVPTSSARLSGVDSELLVNDWHTHVHRDLRSIREIERILHKHLEQSERQQR